MLIPAILLVLAEIVLRLISRTDSRPAVFFAWAVGSLNFVGALLSARYAARFSVKIFFIILAGGAGIRLVFITFSVVLVLMYQSVWINDFSWTLGICFLVYLFAEILLIAY